MEADSRGKRNYEKINYHVDDTVRAYERLRRHPAELRNYLN